MGSAMSYCRRMFSCQKRCDTTSLKESDSLGNLTNTKNPIPNGAEAERGQNGSLAVLTNGASGGRGSGKKASSALTTIRWPAARLPAVGGTVQVAGDWDWASPRPLTRGKDGRSFSVHLPLSPGRHEFKFLLDGEWLTSEAYPTCDNGIGGQNNYVDV